LKPVRPKDLFGLVAQCLTGGLIDKMELSACRAGHYLI
jgi:hypothetical protein